MLRGVLHPGACRLTSQYLRMKADIGEMGLGDGQLARSYASYSDLVTEVLLGELLSGVEQFVGAPLLPTHSYTRLYGHGDELTPHTDRPACEVVVSLTLGFDADSPWPLHIRAADHTFRYALNAGDCVIFAGSHCEHWREPFAGRWQAQTTLHYVRAHGEFAEWVYDKRPGLGRHVGTRRP